MLWKSEVKVKMEPRMDADTNLGGSKSPLIILLAVGMGFRPGCPVASCVLGEGPCSLSGLSGTGCSGTLRRVCMSIRRGEQTFQKKDECGLRKCVGSCASAWAALARSKASTACAPQSSLLRVPSFWLWDRGWDVSVVGIHQAPGARWVSSQAILVSVH